MFKNNSKKYLAISVIAFIAISLMAFAQFSPASGSALEQQNNHGMNQQGQTGSGLGVNQSNNGQGRNQTGSGLGVNQSNNGQGRNQTGSGLGVNQSNNGQGRNQTGSGLGVGQSNNGQGRNQTGSAKGNAKEPLSSEETAALQDAILEEYGALNLYQYVIDTYNYGEPFTDIVKSEQKHIDALVRQAEKYGVTVPANPGMTNQPVFASIEEACEAGVAAEIADADLYDELAPSIQHDDILRVFDNLKTASLKNHLPAFEACK